MWLFLGLLAAILALIVSLIKNFYSYWERRGVPFEEPSFPMGNFKGIGSKYHFRDIYQRIYKRCKGKGPFAGLFFMFQRSALITDLELIRHILITDFSNFRDRGIFSNVEDEPLSGHLFGLDGEQWRALRVKLSPVFTSGKMKFMFPTIVSVSYNLIATCGELVATESNSTLDLKELCARYTTDVIGTCAFGLECNSLKDPNAQFREMGRRISEESRNAPLIRAFLFLNPKLARKLHMKALPDYLHEFFMNAVRTTVDYRIKNNIKRNDFMDMLIEMRAQDQEAARKGNGIDFSQGLTIEQMAAQVFVFFVAGFHSSSATMAFCLYELALNTDIQNRLREEILSVLEHHEGKLIYEAMKEMSYLEQVISETLRKYSVAAHLIRQALHDYKVPNSDLVLEAGTKCIIPISSIQLDPVYFPEPERFDPARFAPEEIAKRHPMTYMPFGDGPRNCIGLRFAKMQAKVGLINLLKNYKFSKSSRTEIPIELDKKRLAIAAKNPIYLRVEKL